MKTTVESINNLMMQNVMALSTDEESKYFVITWNEEIGMKETETKIIRDMVTHTTCPPGGKQDCTPKKDYWTIVIDKNI